MLKFVRFIILLLYAVPLVSASAETVYKTRDKSGNIIFSDEPSEHAEEINIEAPQTIDANQLGRFVYRPKQKVERIDYKIQITRPAPDAVIRENAGNVEINVAVKPAVKPPHKVQVKMNGKLLDGVPPIYRLRHVDRGLHTVVAELVDANGEVIEQSEAVQFTVLRSFIRQQRN